MIGVGDQVRVTDSVAGEVGKVIHRESDLAAVRFDHATTWVPLSELAPAESEPPASQDWTPHDRYTAAALTGLLAGKITTKDSAGFVATARLIADEAMAARGGK